MSARLNVYIDKMMRRNNKKPNSTAVPNACVIRGLFQKDEVETMLLRALDMQHDAKNFGVERHPGCAAGKACKRDLLCENPDLPPAMSAILLEVATSLDPGAKFKVHLMYTWPSSRGHQAYHQDSPGRRTYWTLVVPLTQDTPEMGGTQICRVRPAPTYTKGDHVSMQHMRDQSGLLGQRVAIKWPGEDGNEFNGIVQSTVDESGLAWVKYDDDMVLEEPFRDSDAWRLLGQPFQTPQEGSRIMVYWPGNDRFYAGELRGGTLFYDDGECEPFPPSSSATTLLRWLPAPPKGGDGAVAASGTTPDVVQLASGERYANPVGLAQVRTYVTVFDGEKEQRTASCPCLSEYMGLTVFKGSVVHRGMGNFSSALRVFLYVVVFRGDDDNEF